MKKIISILLLFVLVFSLSGCEKGNNTSSELDTSVQSDVSSTGTSSESTTTSEENSTSTPSANTTPSNTTTSNSTPSNSTPNKTEELKPTVVAGEYTVTFDYGYDNIKTTAKSKNYKVAKPEDPKRSGYKFLSWYAPNETEHWNFSGHAVTNDMTLTANWGKYKYYIFYSTIVNGIETNVLKEKVGSSNQATSSGSSSIPEFKKGFIAGYDTYSVAIGDSFINDEKWASQPGGRDYDLYEFKVPSAFTVDSATFTVPELKFDGLEFLGWTYDGQSTPVKTVTIPKGTTKDYHLVANWKSK